MDPKDTHEPDPKHGEPKHWIRDRSKVKKGKINPALGRSRIQEGVRRRERLPPAVPKNKSMGEVKAMDPDHPDFKVFPGVRKYQRDDVNIKELDWRAQARADKQKRFNERRARARKEEALVVKAIQTLEEPTTMAQNKLGIYDEDKAIAEGILDLEDWDDEELIRGYRRNRDGRWGPPPKYVPREIQQALFRRIAARGDKKMRGAYLASIETLIHLAHNASSEKVQLEATRELMNRVVGKIPDRIHVAQEQPWEEFLADSILPIGDEFDPMPAGEAVDGPPTPEPPALAPPTVSPPVQNPPTPDIDSEPLS